MLRCLALRPTFDTEFAPTPAALCKRILSETRSPRTGRSFRSMGRPPEATYDPDGFSAGCGVGMRALQTPDVGEARFPNGLFIM